MTTHSTSRELGGHEFERAVATAPAPAVQGRTFGLGIWWLALGYFVFYAPYAALTKIVSQGLLSGVDRPVSGVEMLPATGFATAVVTLLIITGLGWWSHLGRRKLLGVTVPWPMRRTLLAGLATAAIIDTTTLMYTFTGVSILLAMILMRCGVLILAPTVDFLFRKRVRWFSWAALGLCLLALVAAAAGLRSYETTWALLVTVGTYVGAYAVRFYCLNTLAKTTDRTATCRYFVEEQLVAMAVLIGGPLTIALVGSSGIPLDIRHGVTSFVSTSALWPSLLIGVLYAPLCWFGTQIYLDRRENTFCISLNRSASLLAGLAASYGIAFLLGERTPTARELIGAALIAVAILVLSPLHHMRWRLGYFERLISRIPSGRSEGALSAVHVNALQVQSDLPAVPADFGHVVEPLSVRALEK
jgi:hypothetical protein